MFSSLCYASNHRNSLNATLLAHRFLLTARMYPIRIAKDILRHFLLKCSIGISAIYCLKKRLFCTYLLVVTILLKLEKSTLLSTFHLILPLHWIQFNLPIPIKLFRVSTCGQNISKKLIFVVFRIICRKYDAKNKPFSSGDSMLTKFNFVGHQ